MRQRYRLSAAKVRAIKRPGRYPDGGGLYVQAISTKGGTLSTAYVMRYAIDGRERWMGLGSTQDVSLSDARTTAEEARNVIKTQGLDLSPTARRSAWHVLPLSFTSAVSKKCLTSLSTLAATGGAQSTPSNLLTA